MSEFNLIHQHFTRPTRNTNLGIGDDAALISVGKGKELAISADMLVAGTHFFADADAYQLGWKSLAVNLSDIAAMGAQPKWATLAIALPSNDADWLKQFSDGFFACANQFGIDLIGGDTTRGPLTISIQIMGEVATGKAIKRSGAQVGDDVWVSGKLGLAALGLAYLQNKQDIPEDVRATHLQALHEPQPRVDLGLNLVGMANSCLDISDGLLADLGHILKTSRVGATLQFNQIPSSSYIESRYHEPAFQQYVLAGGDDYELCFTANEKHRTYINSLTKTLDLPITQIGKIVAGDSISVFDNNNLVVPHNYQGYNHFA